MPDTRKTPLVEVRLYAEGEGDPVVTDHGFAWLDLPQSSFPYGTVSISGNEPTLEVLPGIGLVNRPTLNLQDTRLTQYTVHDTEDWAEEKPATGSPRKYRLLQTSAEADLQWWASSTYSLPQDPHCAFTFILPDTPGNHDAATYPPFVRVEFGRIGAQAQWGIEFSKTYGARLMRWGGAWVPVLELDQPNPAARDVDEVLVLLRCYRGKIGISTDGGRNYRWYGNPDGSYLTVYSSPFTLRGQGSQVVFGLHQLAYTTGAFTSPQRNTFTSRTVPVPVITGRYDVPTGASLVLADATDAAEQFAGLAQYTATLTPTSAGTTPFAFHSGPALYSVTFRYPVAATTPTGAYTTPWDGRICSVEIDKPRELAGGSCHLRVKLPAYTAFTGSYRWRKVQVRLGWRHEDTSEEWWTAFTGYIRRVTPSRDGYGDLYLDLDLDNAAARFQRTEWTALDVLALGGNTLNDAADYILYTEGLGATYRSWHALGSLPLAAGFPEEPFGLLKPRERKWDTLQGLFGLAGLEIAVLDDGTFQSLPFNYLGAASHTYEFKQGDRTNGIWRARQTVDYGESGTAVLVYGQSVTGAPLLAWGVDEWAENPAFVAAGRFAPWREVVQDEVSGRSSPGMLVSRAQGMALEYLPLQYEPEFEAFVNLDVGRRDEIIVNGCAEIGIPDGTSCVVLTLHHSYHVNEDTGEYDLTTVAGLRRV